jgi:selenide,water dikinase
MVKGTPLNFEIRYRDVPVFDGVRDLIAKGMVPEGAYNNLRFLGGKMEQKGVPEEEMLLLSDPQTSGGLLITAAEGAQAHFEKSGIEFWIVGRVVKGNGKIILS